MRRYTFGPQAAWTKGATGVGNCVHHPMTEAMATERIKLVRASFKVSECTGDTTSNAYYEISNDGITWTGQTAIGSTGTDNDEEDANDFVDIYAAIKTKRFVRFGVLLYNTAGSNRELCNLQMRVEFRNN